MGKVIVPATITDRLKALRLKQSVIYKKHKLRLNKIVEELKELQLECPHEHKRYIPDASGNNGSYYECKDCEAEL